MFHFRLQESAEEPMSEHGNFANSIGSVMRNVLLAALCLFAGCQSAKKEEEAAAVCPVIAAVSSEEACKEISDRHASKVITQLDECKKSLAAAQAPVKVESKPDMVKKAKKAKL